jgi:hypothetical protein
MFKSVVNAGESLPAKYETAQQVNFVANPTAGNSFRSCRRAEFVVGNSPYSGKIRRLYIQSSTYFTMESSSKTDSGK